MTTETISDRAARVLSSYVVCPRCSSPVECKGPDGERYTHGYVHRARITKARSALAALATIGLRLGRCATCEKPIIESTSKVGRAALYCSGECRYAASRVRA